MFVISGFYCSWCGSWGASDPEPSNKAIIITTTIIKIMIIITIIRIMQKLTTLNYSNDYENVNI